MFIISLSTFSQTSGSATSILLASCVIMQVFYVPMFSSRKNPYSPHRRSLEIPRGRGVLKAQILEARYKAELEFPGGRGGVQNKKPPMGGVWIFSETAQWDWKF